MFDKRLWVGTVGTNFEPGVWDAIMAASRYCGKKGYNIVVERVANCCVEPFHGLALMRNISILHALREKATHLLLLDNDVLLNEDDIARMLAAMKLAVVPFLDQSKLDRVYRLQNPCDGFPEGEHLVQLDWAVWSCVLLNLDPFYGGLDPRLFSDHMAVGEDAYYWDYLALRGYELWQCRDVRPVLLRKPVAFFNMQRRGCVHMQKRGNEMEPTYVPNRQPFIDPPVGYAFPVLDTVKVVSGGTP